MYHAFVLTMPASWDGAGAGGGKGSGTGEECFMRGLWGSLWVGGGAGDRWKWAVLWLSFWLAFLLA